MRHLLCQRIGAQLELHDLRPVLLAAFEVEHGSGRVGRPQRSTLPAGICIVNAPFHPFGEEADGIGHAQIDELPIHQGEQGVVHVARGDRHVFP